MTVNRKSFKAHVRKSDSMFWEFFTVERATLRQPCWEKRNSHRMQTTSKKKQKNKGSLTLLDYNFFKVESLLWVVPLKKTMQFQRLYSLSLYTYTLYIQMPKICFLIFIQAVFLHFSLSFFEQQIADPDDEIFCLGAFY